MSCLKRLLLLTAVSAVCLLVSPRSDACTANRTYSGTMTSSETWCAVDGPHILTGNLTVAPAATLTLEAGAIVKAPDGVRLTIKGDLQAPGTAGSPILFTALNAWAWGGLVFDGTGTGARGTGSLVHTTIEQGRGASLWDGTHLSVALNGVQVAPVSFQNCTIRTGTRGIWVYDSKVSVVDSTFTNLGYVYAGLNDSVWPMAVSGSSSRLTMSGNTFKDNQTWGPGASPNSVVLYPGALTGADFTLAAQTAQFDGYYLIQNFEVPAGKTMTVQAGVTVMAPGSVRLTVKGNLVAAGMAANPALFTGYASALWGGLIFDGGGGGGTGNLTYAIIEKAAGASLVDDVRLESMVKDVQNGEVRFQNCTIRNGSRGLWVYNSRATVLDSTFTDLGYGYAGLSDAVWPMAVSGSTSQVTMTGNAFTGNQSNRVAIYPGAMTGTDFTLTPQTGLDGYEFMGSFEVPASRTLTVAAGATVMGRGSTALVVRGNLVATGTAAQPARFTCVDTQQGWTGVVFEGGTGDLLNAIVEYGGVSHPLNPYPMNAIVVARNVQTGEVRFRNSTIQNSSHGIRVINSKVSLSDTTLSNVSSAPVASYVHPPIQVAGISSRLTMTNCTFQNNQWPQIVLEPDASAPVPNTLATLSADSTLTAHTGLQGYAFGGAASGPQGVVPAGRVLTLEAGTGMFMSGPVSGGFSRLTVQGRMVASGTAAKPVTFSGGESLWIDGGTALLRHVVSTMRVHAQNSAGGFRVENSRFVSPSWGITGAQSIMEVVNTAFTDILPNGTAIALQGGCQLTGTHLTFARGWGAVSADVADQLTLTNSIIAGVQYGVWIKPASTATLRNTLWDNVRFPTDGPVIELGSISGSAAFAADGYHITAASAGVAKGIATSLTDEIDGEVRPRPAGSLPDLGADEIDAGGPGPVRTPISITLGPVTAGTARPGSFADYVLALAAGQAHNLLVKLRPTGGTGTWELFGRLGALPDTTAFDFTGKSQPDGSYEMLIPNPTAGSWYFSVLFSGASGTDGAFTIQVTGVDRYLSSISPASGGNTGPVTVQLSGFGFVSGVSVKLRAAGITVGSFSPVSWNESTLSTRFDLTGYAPRSHDVCVVWPDAFESCLPGGFTVVAGGTANLVAQLFVPAQGRDGRPTTLVLEYRNAGTVDMPAPYFIIVSLQNVQQRLDPLGQWRRAPVAIMGLDLDALGTAGTLPPGKTFRVPFQVIPEGDAHAQLRWQLNILPTDSTDLVNWAEQEADLRPPGIPDQAWARIWPAYKADMGTTWADVQQALRLTAGAVSEAGRVFPDPKRLAIARMRAISGENVPGAHAAEIDMAPGGPGIPLSFGRMCSLTIPGRFRLGPLGYGWTHSAELSLAKRTDGTVVVGLDGVGELYRPTGNGAYRSMPGNPGVLREDGTFFILQDSGSITRTFGASGRLEMERDSYGSGLNYSYDSSGRLIRITHTNGWAISLTYDGAGRLVSATDPFGRGVTYSYSGDFLTRVTGAGGRYVTYSYNTIPGHAAQNALIASVDMDGRRVDYGYDSLGRFAAFQPSGEAAAHLTTDAGGRLQVTNQAGESFLFRADDLGRFALAQDSLGNTARLVLDDASNPVSATDEAGRRTTMEWGPAGNPLSSTDPSSTKASLGWVYPPSTPAPRNVSVTDGAGNTAVLVRDSHGALMALQHPGGSTETMERDARGLISAVTNRRGQRIEYGHDSLGRVVSKTRPGSSPVTFGYDSLGRMDRRGDASASFVATYDATDSVTRLTSPDGTAVAYSFDVVGRRASMTYPDGYRITYESDSAGRLSRIAGASGGSIVSYQYDTAGRLLREDKGNGTATTYAYGPLGRLTAITHLGVGGVLLESFSYTYDAVGNVLSVTSSAGTATFEYDSVDFLTRAVLPGGRTISVRYDAAGNRVQVSDGGVTTAYAHDVQNRTTQAGPEAFSYDADGNLISRTGPAGTASYNWDAEGQITGATHPSLGAVTYAYDVLGRRLSETIGSATSRFVHDGDVPIAEYDASGHLVARYVHGIGLSARIAADETTAYYGFDAAGNTRFLTGGDGAIVNRYDYTPWGVPTAVTETVANAFRFAGQAGVRTSPLGHVLMGVRAYDPGLGRFISADPLRYNSGLNLYSYAGNNPIRWWDPSGMITQKWYVYAGGKAIGLITTVVGVSPLSDRVSVAIGSLLLNTGVSVKDLAYTNLRFSDIPGNAPKILDTMTSFGDVSWSTIGTFVPAAIGEIAKANLKNVALQGAAQRAPIYFAAGTVTLMAMETIFDGMSDDFQRDIDFKIKYPDRVPRNMYFVLHELYGQNVPSWAWELYGLQPPPLDNTKGLDPNEKLNTPGMGAAHSVRAGDRLYYQVCFENIPSASGPAQEVFVDDQLDSNLDLSTLTLQDIGWGDQVLPAESDQPSYSNRVSIPDYRPGDARRWWVDVSAQTDSAGLLKLVLRTIDPATGDLPTDPQAGFLPPNDATGRGQGWISFTAKTKTPLTPGTRILNKASIVFDTNPAIKTNEVFNTIGLNGDVNGDGIVNPADVFYLVNYLYSGGAAPLGPSDVNLDNRVNALDLFYLINYLYAGGPAPL